MNLRNGVGKESKGRSRRRPGGEPGLNGVERCAIVASNNYICITSTFPFGFEGATCRAARVTAGCCAPHSGRRNEFVRRMH